jgi:hypothetical protein
MQLHGIYSNRDSPWHIDSGEDHTADPSLCSWQNYLEGFGAESRNEGRRRR